MKTLECQKVFLGELNESLRYELLENRVEDHTVYGVSVLKERAGERAQVSDITSVRAQAERFFGQVVRGAVTPLTLREVAEDFVANE